MKQNTALETGLEDATRLIESLELPYLEALQNILAQHIIKRRSEAMRDAIDEIRRIAARVGMSADELMGAAAQPKKQQSKSTLAPRYRHPDGRTWSGQGRAPEWIKDQDREQFRINNGAST